MRSGNDDTYSSLNLFKYKFHKLKKYIDPNNTSSDLFTGYQNFELLQSKTDLSDNSFSIYVDDEKLGGGYYLHLGTYLFSGKT